MGNSGSTLCAVPSPQDLEQIQSVPIIPSEEELDSYVSDIKSVVKGCIETPEDRYKRYVAAFTPNAERLREAANSFREEMVIGLDCHKRHPFDYIPEECSFKMLDSFVPRAPSGKETGVYYALDFGGTNFRVVRVQMDNGKFKVTARKANLMDCETGLPKGLLDPKASATLMFDFFAKVSEDFVKESGDLGSSKPLPLGFTWSYPYNMRSINTGYHVVWTKGFETGRETDDPVEGTDAAELMNQAFVRRGLPLRVNAVANDTVGTLLSCSYSLPKDKPPCMVGLILGTGMNACYVEDRAHDYGYVGNIINMECGNFNRSTLPRTNVDYELDFDDVGGRGRQHLEKMTSGAYLGDICRRVLVKIFQYKANPMMWQSDSWTSEDASVVIGDKSASLVVVARKVMERWNTTFTHQELQWVQGVCRVVFERAAALAAMLIAGTALRTGRLQEALGGLTVGIDGSLYKCNPFLRDDVRKYLRVILGEKQADLINLEFADDGSGLGAAILSAIISESSH